MDPFCLFAVVPILAVGGFAIYGDLAILGIPLIVVAALIVVIDSWANRPRKKSAPEYRENRRR